MICTDRIYDLLAKSACLASEWAQRASLPEVGLHSAAAVAVAALWGGVAHAGTYYVDSSLGSDSNNGTSISSPLRTLNKVSTVPLRPGDSVLLKRGQTWREQLNIYYAGAAGSPITIGAYGQGARPVISGADLVKSPWSVYSNKIYVSTLPPNTIPTYVYVDGGYYDPARYPDSGFIAGLSSPTSSRTSVSAPTLNISAQAAAGALITTKTTAWQIDDAAEVATFNPTSHILTTKANFADDPMTQGFGFFLHNKLWMLSKEKEWFFDRINQKLYTWLIGGLMRPVRGCICCLIAKGVRLFRRGYLAFLGCAGVFPFGAQAGWAARLRVLLRL